MRQVLIISVLSCVPLYIPRSLIFDISIFDDRLTITVHRSNRREGKNKEIFCLFFCQRSFWFLPVHKVYEEESPNQRSLQLLSNEAMKKMKFKSRQYEEVDGGTCMIVAIGKV